jgi:hypothetical protein
MLSFINYLQRYGKKSKFDLIFLRFAICLGVNSHSIIYIINARCFSNKLYKQIYTFR